MERLKINLQMSRKNVQLFVIVAQQGVQHIHIVNVKFDYCKQRDKVLKNLKAQCTVQSPLNAILGGLKF